MSFHAANPAGFSYLSLCLAEQANKSLSTRNYGGDCALLTAELAPRIALQLR
jgi:hypothetical protein